MELVFQLQLQDQQFLMLAVEDLLDQLQMVQAALVELGVVQLYLWRVDLELQIEVVLEVETEVVMETLVVQV